MKLPSVNSKGTIFIGTDSYVITVTRISPSGKTIYCKHLGEEIKVKWDAKGEYFYRSSNLAYKPSVTFDFAKEHRDPGF